MAVEYREAPEPEALANSHVIPDWHKELSDVSILWLFRDNMKRRNRVVLAKIRKATAVENHIGEYDLVVIVNEPAWNGATPAQRIAIVDHELCHVYMDDGQIKMRGHDLEEFEDIVKRHGAWKGDIQSFVEAQGDMFRGNGSA